MIEDVATELTLSHLERFGAFSLVIVAAVIVIWWLVREMARQRLAFTKVIEEKERQITEEKNHSRTVTENAFKTMGKLETALTLLSERVKK